MSDYEEDFERDDGVGAKGGQPAKKVVKKKKKAPEEGSTTARKELTSDLGKTVGGGAAT
jgi:hypothetical protein